MEGNLDEGLVPLVDAERQFFVPFAVRSGDEDDGDEEDGEEDDVGDRD